MCFMIICAIFFANFAVAHNGIHNSQSKIKSWTKFGTAMRGNDTLDLKLFDNNLIDNNKGNGNDNDHNQINL